MPTGRLRVRGSHHDHLITAELLQGVGRPGLQIDSRADLDRISARCAELGVAHAPLEARPDGDVIDIPDPDGTVIRCYAVSDRKDTFLGVRFSKREFAGVYETPTLAD